MVCIHHVRAARDAYPVNADSSGVLEHPTVYRRRPPPPPGAPGAQWLVFMDLLLSDGAFGEARHGTPTRTLRSQLRACCAKGIQASWSAAAVLSLDQPSTKD